MTAERISVLMKHSNGAYASVGIAVSVFTNQKLTVGSSIACSITLSFQEPSTFIACIFNVTAS
jgi:hypothetical protein